VGDAAGVGAEGMNTVTQAGMQGRSRSFVWLLAVFVLSGLAFFALGAMLGPSLPISRARTPEAVVTRFHRLFYDSVERTWDSTKWLGVPVLKCPMDLVIYQEILSDTKPDVLIEAGTFKGGSALFYASIMDLLGRGRVITIDIENQGRPPHPRIAYLEGYSTAPAVVSAVKSMLDPRDRVMVVLDSDHSASNVLNELRTYAPLVSAGAYLIVEDTNINGHPVRPGIGPGPAEALDEFLAENKSFMRDAARERFLLTFNPGGYLRKIS
jgi:cephalosporin hydroxylase